MADKKEITYMTAEEGSIVAKQGLEWEREVNKIFNYKENFEKLKYNKKVVGYKFDIFEKMFKKFNLNIENIQKIISSCDAKDIGRFPSNGVPKTDVLLKVFYNDGKFKYITISCKRCTKKEVAAHEYDYQEICNVLDIKDEKLISCIRLFQEKGNARDMGKEFVKYLKENIIDYREKLLKWVIGGHGGAGDPETQWADYIVTYKVNTDEVQVESVEDYVKKILNSRSKRGFGTGLFWTYPSKKKGLKIKFKIPIF